MKVLRVAVLGLLLCAGAHGARSLEAGGPIAITSVTVIDTTGSPSKPNMTVVIEGERIAAVGESGGAKIPKNARVVDGKGKFLINPKMKVLWMSATSENRGITPKVLRDHIEGVVASICDHEDAWDFSKWGKAGEVKTEAKK